MVEIDRVLRPGGYWVLSGPPINWNNNYQAWQRPKEELEEEQRKIEELAKLLCWEKKHEIGEIAIWQKRINNGFCREQDRKQTTCKPTSPDDVWYVFVNFRNKYILNIYSPNNLLERSLTLVEKFKIVFYFPVVELLPITSSKNNDSCECCSLCCFVSLFIYLFSLVLFELIVICSNIDD